MHFHVYFNIYDLYLIIEFFFSICVIKVLKIVYIIPIISMLCLINYISISFTLGM